jgi:hypothetical protein
MRTNRDFLVDDSDDRVAVQLSKPPCNRKPDDPGTNYADSLRSHAVNPSKSSRL